MMKEISANMNKSSNTTTMFVLFCLKVRNKQAEVTYSVKTVISGGLKPMPIGIKMFYLKVGDVYFVCCVTYLHSDSHIRRKQ